MALRLLLLWSTFALIASGCESEGRIQARRVVQTPVKKLAGAALRYRTFTGRWPTSVDELDRYESVAMANAEPNLGFNSAGLSAASFSAATDSSVVLSFEFDDVEVNQDLYAHYVDPETGGYNALEPTEYRPQVVHAVGSATLITNGRGGRSRVSVSSANVRLPDDDHVYHFEAQEFETSTYAPDINAARR